MILFFVNFLISVWKGTEEDKTFKELLILNRQAVIDNNNNLQVK